MKYNKQKFQDYVAAGLCGKCGKRPLQSKTMCEVCLKHIRNSHAKRKQKGTCSQCSREPVHGQSRCSICIETQKRYYYKLKDEVYSAYGGYQCACCGVTEKAFLSLDHINNDGAAQRREGNGIGYHLYLWIIRNNFPQSFQVLCHNCQWGKRIHGECPHKLKEQNDTRNDNS